MHAIRDYFKKNGRNPTDVELESLAQTWSEHCKHTIFASAMDDDVPAGLYKTYIQAATNKIREEKGENDICLSVFSDNSGAIIFDDQYLVTHKVETHNSPSALDPFGGALTGIVGVNRDTIGFGLGAKPCINIYGFCVGDPDRDPVLYRMKGRENPVLTPRKILDGVVHGVGVGGNCSGIPTPQGFVYFDDRYGGKPLVFAGTVGIMPRERDGKKLYEKRAQAGDLIVVAGGRVGKDGIHGATFSSEALDPASPVTAVQIGDPITQKKVSDVIVKEARDLGLYRSITDNGAGGISCSVAEMAKECNGCRVTLDAVPLKYPGHGPVGDLDLGVAGADDACGPPGTSRTVHGTNEAPGCRSHGHRGIHGFRPVRCGIPWEGRDGYRTCVPARRPPEKPPQDHVHEENVSRAGGPLPGTSRQYAESHAPAPEYLLQGVHLDPVRPHGAGRPRARPAPGPGPGAGSFKPDQSAARLEERGGAVPGDVPFVFGDRSVSYGRGRD